MKKTIKMQIMQLVLLSFRGCRLMVFVNIQASLFFELRVRFCA